MGRGIQAGRVWPNCYHLYPAGRRSAAYKNSGVGRENHRMMLDHYSQTKCVLVSYDPNSARLLLMPQQLTATPAALDLTSVCGPSTAT